jgi:ABC-2 type transport system permease protein
MSKLRHVALYEYRRHVLTRRFVLVVLSMPAILAFLIGMIAVSIHLTRSTKAVGYVDLSGVLANPRPAPQRGTTPDEPSAPALVPILAFPAEDDARRALEQGEVQAYYLIPGDYPVTGEVDLVYQKPPSEDARRQFWDFMQVNLLRDLPPEIADRAVAGSDLIAHWPDSTPGGAREFSQRTFLSTFMPFILGIAFVFLLLSGSGYFLGAVVEEREGRTMEVMLTSLSTAGLMTGKLLAILSVTLTQALGWLFCSWLAIALAGNVLDLSLFQGIQIDLRVVGIMLAVSLPAFVLLAGLMTAVGSMVTEAHEGQQLMPVFVLPMMAPLWLAGLIMEEPNSPLAIGLSLFPPTSVPAYSLRLGFAAVPAWQVATTIALSTACAVAAIWLAGRALRLGMLRYGRRLNWRALLQAQRQLGDEG